MYKTLQVVALAGLWATNTFAQADDIECTEGLHMIIARGTTEPQGPGDLGRIAGRIAARIEGSAIQPVVYPATYVEPYHVDSIKNGSNAARKAITEYAEKCPGGKIALLGYSQGAQVIGNSICGDRGGWLNGTALDDDPHIQLLFGEQDDHLKFEDGPGVDKDLILGKLISVLLFGDPTYSSEPAFAEGTAEGEGLWPRDWSECSDYSSRTRSYCDSGDIICDTSAEYIDGVHVDYTRRYGVDAVEFAIEKWNEATGADVEVDGGDRFPGLDDTSPPNGNSSIPTPIIGGPTSTPSTSDTEESVPTAAANGLHAAGSLLFGAPLAAFGAWALV